MGSILTPGYLRWDGFKYVLDPTVEIVGPPGPPGPSLPGPPGPAGAAGAAGASGNAVLVYQQGGITAGNVFASWTALMAQRATTPFVPMTIVIDNSIVAEPSVDPGVWDLTNNTAIAGYKTGVSEQPTASLSFGNSSSSAQDAQLLHASYFENIFLVDKNVTLPAIDASPSGATLTFYNVLVANSSSTPFINADNVGFIVTGGAFDIITGVFAGGTGTSGLDIFLNDYSIIPSGTIVLTGEGSVISAFINGINSSMDIGQTPEPIFQSGNLAGSFSSASIGTVLTKTADNAADWLAPSSGFTAGGDLSGSSTSQQVDKITGSGTDPYTSSGTTVPILATSTTLASNNSVTVDDFISNPFVTFANTFTTIATIPVLSSPFCIVDVALSVIGFSSSGTTVFNMYRADVTFSAYWNGSAVTILQPTNPQNVRTTSGASTWVGIQAIASGNNVLVQVGGFDTVHSDAVIWNCIGQVQRSQF
jgi:hypothetical protein